jgi:hypothetical protein
MAASNIKALQDARQAMRYPTSFLGEVLVWRQSLVVMITDISRRGALLKAAALPSAGEEVTLKARCLEVVATVVWTKSGFAGLCFHRDIEPLEVVRQNADEMWRFRTMRRHGPPRST